MTTNTLQKNAKTSNKTLFVLFVLLLLSSVGMFGQQVKGDVPAAPITAQVAAAGDNTDAQMELVSWFMGTKESKVSGAANSTNTISTNNTGKKQFINSGMTTNRLLSRSFLRKAISRDSTIA